MPRVPRTILVAWGLAAALLVAVKPGSAAAEPAADPAQRLAAIVAVKAEVPAEARTAGFLGTKREGSGVLIDDAGLIVTIGYLITEAMAAEVVSDRLLSRHCPWRPQMAVITRIKSYRWCNAAHCGA